MNPDTNKLEKLFEQARAETSSKGRQQLYRADGTPVPEHWSTFQVGEHVVIKNYTFKVAYIGETAILFEPVGPIVVETDK